MLQEMHMKIIQMGLRIPSNSKMNHEYGSRIGAEAENHPWISRWMMAETQSREFERTCAKSASGFSVWSGEASDESMPMVVACSL